MRKILLALSKEGSHFTFHCLAFACLLLAGFIVTTAADMGPFAPLLVSSGVYLGIFGLTLEFLYWLGSGVRRLASRWVS